MNAIEALIAFSFSITFGPPLLFVIIGLAKRKRNKESAKVFYILATVWFIVGGGICASLLT